MPIASRFNETDNNRRKYKAFKEDANIDLTPFLDPAQEYYYDMMRDLNDYYCSVYA
jgi:hypothetical protein